jgi:hypothetical protein
MRPRGAFAAASQQRRGLFIRASVSMRNAGARRAEAANRVAPRARLEHYI